MRKNKKRGRKNRQKKFRKKKKENGKIEVEGYNESKSKKRSNEGKKCM
jgi:hypothetical protein